jgi:hypothetical protein
VLYWQGTSRKQLAERLHAARFLPEAWKLVWTTCPEAMGVNVFVTARLAGLFLDKTRHLSICRHVALIGYGKY